jgi:hypothetical protein
LSGRCRGAFSRFFVLSFVAERGGVTDASKRTGTFPLSVTVPFFSCVSSLSIIAFPLFQSGEAFLVRHGRCADHPFLTIPPAPCLSLRRTTTRNSSMRCSPVRLLFFPLSSFFPSSGSHTSCLCFFLYDVFTDTRLFSQFSVAVSSFSGSNLVDFSYAGESAKNLYATALPPSELENQLRGAFSSPVVEGREREAKRGSEKQLLSTSTPRKAEAETALYSRILTGS